MYYIHISRFFFLLIVIGCGILNTMSQEVCDIYLNGDASSELLSYEAGIPSAQVDIVEAGEDLQSFGFVENQDMKSILSSYKKAILFAVPGAFTPTCSSKHLPGFISHSKKLQEKGVDAIFCLSVNDKFVMKAWAEATSGALESGIKFIADGNGDFTAKIHAENDRRSGRMGIRSQRYVMIIQNGVISHVFKDLSSFSDTAAENIFSFL